MNKQKTGDALVIFGIILIAAGVTIYNLILGLVITGIMLIGLGYVIGNGGV